MTPIDFKELTTLSQAGIVWGFFWRCIATALGSALCGALLGGIVGFVLGISGIARSAIPMIGGLLGLLTGLFFFYLYVRWLLASRLGAFRLVLVLPD